MDPDNIQNRVEKNQKTKLEVEIQGHLVRINDLQYYGMDKKIKQEIREESY